MAAENAEQSSDVRQGRLIKAAREKRGLSLRELASRLNDGTHFTTLGKIERGIMRVSIERLMKLADVLQVPFFELVSDRFDYQKSTRIPIYSRSSTLGSMTQEEMNNPDFYMPYAQNADEPHVGFTFQPPDDHSILDGVAYIVISPLRKTLHDGGVYALAVHQDTEIAVGVFRQSPPRFVPWPFITETVEFEIGAVSFQVEGQVRFYGLFVADPATPLD